MKSVHDVKGIDLVEIGGNSLFGDCIKKTIAEIHPKKLIETGTYKGLGTTKIICDALEGFNYPKAFHSIESNPQYYLEALGNIRTYAKPNDLTVHLGISVPKHLLPSLSDIKDSLNTAKAENIYVDHSELQRAQNYFNETNQDTVEYDLLGKIMEGFNYKADFVLLDSAGHMGFIEFLYFLSLLTSDCVIALDDTNHFKHYLSLKMIRSDPRFEIIEEGNEKFGFCICKFSV